MEFDIISVTEEYYAELNAKQRNFLRTAQKKKNALEKKAEKEIAQFRRKLYTNSVQTSTLLDQKTLEILTRLEYEIEIIREQLLYDMTVEEKPEKVEGPDHIGVEYLVDYSLSYTERYVIVRDYYLSIPDPQARVDLYLKDEVARDYLGRYYTSLYNVLLTYC